MKRTDLRELELLAPAKDKEIGIAAINCGADAVYIAAEHFGAREAASNSLQDIKELIEYAHLFHVRIYAVVNTILYDSELNRAIELIWNLYKIGIDAIIVQDLGLLTQELPPVPLFASTQTDIRDKDKARLLESLGFDRLILARELSLDQIKEIHSAVKIDIETFVHGALCVSYSGQCYLSQRITNRSANRGACAQACRNNYDLVDADGKVLIRNRHLLSLKDLNLSSRIADLVEAGVSSFKVEGRLKNRSFVRSNILLYNKKIDEFINSHVGKNYTRSSLGYVDAVVNPDSQLTFNRGFTQLFIDGKRGDWNSTDSAKYLGEYIGKVVWSRLNKQGFMELCYDSDKQVVNGDGLCFIDAKNGVKGLRANSCNMQAKVVTTTEKYIIKPGTKIYRNYNFAYEKSLERSSENRYIPLFATFIIDSESPKIRIECFKSNETAPLFSYLFPIEYGYERANNIESAMNNISLQLSKRSSHFAFKFVGFEGDVNSTPFFPISVLNAVRGRIAEVAADELEKIRITKVNSLRVRAELLKNRRDKFINDVKDGHGGEFSYAPHDVDRYWKPFLLNSSNIFSKDLYRDLGISLNPCSYELEPEKDAVLMRTKYCIKFQLGLCRKHNNSNNHTDFGEFKEPLYLCNNNQRFKLVFDCEKCEMMLIG